jgi:hypothetical protein
LKNGGRGVAVEEILSSGVRDFLREIEGRGRGFK